MSQSLKIDKKEKSRKEKSLEAQAKPHYHGHRQRLKDRFLKNPTELPDYELVELMLYLVYPRQDVKARAKELLIETGSLTHMLQSSPPAISQGLFLIFQMMAEVTRRVMAEDLKVGPLLNNSQRVVEYCRHTMAHLTTEQFRIFFLDSKHTLIRDEVVQGGTVDQVSLYPREVIKRALELNATGLLLVHNHPSGNPQPSRADIEMTHFLQKSLLPFTIRILDHFIIGQFGYFSFREQGILVDKNS